MSSNVSKATAHLDMDAAGHWADLNHAAGGPTGSERPPTTKLLAAEEILPTLVVQSTKPQNIVNNLYKGTTTPLRVGDGRTMSAIRSELETGQQTNGAWHLTKGANEYQGLTNWLARNPNGAYSDRLVAQSLVD